MKIKVISLIFAAFLLLSSYAHAEKIVVIVNVANSQTITLDYLKNIYSDNIIDWDNGKRIQTFELPLNEPVREVFSKKVLGMSANDSAKEWSNRKITNTAKNPPKTKQSKFVATAVAMNKFAIGYVEESLVKGKEGIKIALTIDE